jgi:hypothetical protein
MIVTPFQGGLLVVAQADHGLQVETFARSWGSSAVAPLAGHRAASVLAARVHDDGWAGWDRYPTLDRGRGQPVAFFDVSPSEHLPLLRAGIAHAAQLDPWAGLLVSLHCAGLYNDRYGTYPLEELGQRFTADERALVDAFLHEEERRQRALIAQCPDQPQYGPPAHAPDVRQAYLALQIWDRLSLQFALRHGRDVVIGHLPLAPGEVTELTCRHAGSLRLALDPYPFEVDPLVAPLRASIVADRPYRDAAEFFDELLAAPALTLTCELVGDGRRGAA